MKFFYLLPIIGATLAMAAPQPVAEPGRQTKGGVGLIEIGKEAPSGGCIPASCASFGCCSGNCGYWCRACGIDYGC
ncbi:hypothetical protein QBC42DRAFT_293639 [Cladorrhinum samala]|uniref:Uncharacterized protein n=1 Tax=Cladorrhinum samala TaxID=585594 RepID=A0AAV9HYU1_9PEZI|nr:hypothetical protein QBC42DRAFT_293639 [Cladorrhinum samala]